MREESFESLWKRKRKRKEMYGISWNFDDFRRTSYIFLPHRSVSGAAWAAAQPGQRRAQRSRAALQRLPGCRGIKRLEEISLKRTNTFFPTYFIFLINMLSIVQIRLQWFDLSDWRVGGRIQKWKSAEAPVVLVQLAQCCGNEHEVVRIQAWRCFVQVGLQNQSKPNPFPSFNRRGSQSMAEGKHPASARSPVRWAWWSTGLMKVLKSSKAKWNRLKISF